MFMVCVDVCDCVYCPANHPAGHPARDRSDADCGNHEDDHTHPCQVAVGVMLASRFAWRKDQPILIVKDMIRLLVSSHAMRRRRV